MSEAMIDLIQTNLETTEAKESKEQAKKDISIPDPAFPAKHLQGLLNKTKQDSTKGKDEGHENTK